MFNGTDTPLSDIDVGRYLDTWEKYHNEMENVEFDHNSKRGSEFQPNKLRAANTLSDHLYQNLSIIDAKASALITSNSIVTGLIFAAIINRQIFLHSKSTVININKYRYEINVYSCFSSITTFLLMLSLIALYINLSVVKVKWSAADDFHSRETPFDRARSLIKTRSRRTRTYRLSLFIHRIVILFSAIITLFIVVFNSYR